MIIHKNVCESSDKHSSGRGKEMLAIKFRVDDPFTVLTKEDLF